MRFLKFKKSIKDCLRFLVSVLKCFKVSYVIEGARVVYSLRSYPSRVWFVPRYLNRHHEPVICKIIFKLGQVFQNGIFFDVGSNIGFFSILSAKFFKSVYSFEIDPTLILEEIKHLKLNDLQGQVLIVPMAVSNINGVGTSFRPFITDEIYQDEVHSTNSILSSKERSRHYDFFPLQMSLDEFCQKNDVYPDLIKMDIEGAEAFAIPGMQAVLKDKKPVLLLEFHPNMIAKAGYDVTSLNQFILGHGYAAYEIKAHRDCHLNLVPLEKIDRNCMVLYVPESKLNLLDRLKS